MKTKFTASQKCYQEMTLTYIFYVMIASKWYFSINTQSKWNENFCLNSHLLSIFFHIFIHLWNTSNKISKQTEVNHLPLNNLSIFGILDSQYTSPKKKKPNKLCRESLESTSSESICNQLWWYSGSFLNKQLTQQRMIEKSYI